MSEAMTDFQFKSLLKMVLKIVKSSKSVEEIAESIEELIGNEKE